MKKSNLLLVSIFTSLALLTGCSQNNAVDNTSTEIKSNEASTEISKYQEMKGEQLDKIEEDNKKKEDYLVIDVRSEDEYKEGHVKHAINIPLDDADKRISEISDYKEKNVVAICNTGKKSSEMAKKLVEAGFKNVWNAQGVKDFEYTTITKVATILPEEFKEKAASGNYTIIDARDEKDYNDGHIKDAIHTSVDTIDEDIKDLPKEKPFLTYCYSGNKSWTVADKLSKEGHEVYNAWDGTKEYDGYELIK